MSAQLELAVISKGHLPPWLDFDCDRSGAAPLEVREKDIGDDAWLSSVMIS